MSNTGLYSEIKAVLMYKNTDYNKDEITFYMDTSLIPESSNFLFFIIFQGGAILSYAIVPIDMFNPNSTAVYFSSNSDYSAQIAFSADGNRLVPTGSSAKYYGISLAIYAV